MNNRATFIITFFMYMVFAQSTALANTFVGNGGSAGDLELLITKKQLSQTLEKIASQKDAKQLCTCQPVFENHTECRPLNNLSDEQENFCSQNLKNVAAHAESLLKQNQVKFNWTREDILFEFIGHRAPLFACT